MTRQQEANILLANFQSDRAVRMRLAGLRETQLAEYYAGERRRGALPVEACERMGVHARFLDGELERDLQIIRDCIGRVT